MSEKWAGMIAKLKRAAKRPITEQDLWEFVAAGIGIRKFFKGNLVNFKGGESSQDLFDRKLKECFGLAVVWPQNEPKATRRPPKAGRSPRPNPKEVK